MKGKNIIITALAVTLLTACKDKTYKSPTLDAMRSADKARAAWARETEAPSREIQVQESPTDTICGRDSTSSNYSEEESHSPF